MALLPTSMLKAGIEALGSDEVIKTTSVKNRLLKAGVKQEELDYSGVEEALATTDKKTLTKAELQALEANRKDKFDSVELTKGDAKYGDTTIDDPKSSGYTEDIRTYHTTKEEGSAAKSDAPGVLGELIDEFEPMPMRKVTSHWSRKIPDYMVHSRHTTTKVGDVDNTRLVQEIQSDLHQAGRQRGYQGDEGTATYDIYNSAGIRAQEELSQADAEAMLRIYRTDDPEAYMEMAETSSKVNQVPDAPLKKNWARKEIERQILGAVDKGQGAIAIPLEGFKNELNRGEGVQKWYETQVRDTLKKIAKQIPGAEYKEVTSPTGSTREFLLSPAELDHLLESDDEIWEAVTMVIAKADGAVPYSSSEAITALDRDQILKSIPENIRVKLMVKPKVTGQIKLPIKAKVLPLTWKQTQEANSKVDLIARLTTEVEKHKAELALPVKERQMRLSKEHHNAMIAKKQLQLKGLKAENLHSATVLEGEVPEWTKKFELYSAGALAIAAAANPDDAAAQEAVAAEENPIGKLLQDGEKPEDIMEVLKVKYSADDESARRQVLRSIQENINSLKGKEDPELIKEAVAEKYGEFIAGEEFNYGEGTPDFPQEDEDATVELVPVADVKQFDEKSTRELYFANENINTSLRDLAKGIKASILEDTAGQEEFNTYLTKTNTHIANSLRQLGRNVEPDPETGELVEIDEFGTKTPITEGFWSDAIPAMMAAEKEMIASIGGAALGAKLAAPIAAPFATLGLPGKLAAGAILAGGAWLGSAIVTPAGRALDIAYNSYTEKEEIEADFYRQQMIDAGVFDAIMGPLTMGGVAVAKGIYKGTAIASKKLLQGNKAGARKAMEQFTNLNAEQIDEIIVGLEKVTTTKLPGDADKRAFAAVAQTQPGAEELVAQAAKYDPALVMNLSRTIDARAKDILKLTESITPDNIGVVVTDELGKHNKMVKTFYGSIKDAGTKSMKGAYAFDYDKLTITPLLRKTHDSITNPAVQERLMRYIEKVEGLSKTRSFENLLELKRTMNDFKYNSRIRSGMDWDAVNAVVNKIDNEIVSAAKKNMPNADTWLKDWKVANIEYRKMKMTQKNVLYKALMKPGMNPKKTIAAMANHITDIDGTFMEVLDALPKRTRGHVEGAVLSHLAEKHTLGEAVGLQAIDFPALQAELKHIAFSSAQSRQVKKAVNILAEVYKNDHNLARLSTTIHTEKAAQGLTTDLVAKAHYSLMAKVWNKMQSIMPFSKDANFTALGIHLEKVMRSPQDTKAVTELLKLFPGDKEIEDGVHQLAIATAQFGQTVNRPYITVHKVGSPAIKNGKYGPGTYWSTDAGDIKSSVGPSKGKVSKREILPERIATPADIRSILKVEELTPELIKNSPDLIEKLKNRGYDGFAIEHDVLIFKE